VIDCQDQQEQDLRKGQLKRRKPLPKKKSHHPKVILFWTVILSMYYQKGFFGEVKSLWYE
jgi:hypothetical protein